MSERDEFEAWANKHNVIMDGYPQYSAWNAWQAARASQAVPEGWKLVPVEPTREMWAAFNKLDDEMAAGSYDGTGCSFEQGWNCMLAASPANPNVAFCRVEHVIDNDSMLTQLGAVRGDKLYTMDQMRSYADAFHRARSSASPAALTLTGDEVRAIVKSQRGSSNAPQGSDYVMATLAYLNRRTPVPAALTDDAIADATRGIARLLLGDVRNVDCDIIESHIRALLAASPATPAPAALTDEQILAAIAQMWGWFNWHAGSWTVQRDEVVEFVRGLLAAAPQPSPEPKEPEHAHDWRFSLQDHVYKCDCGATRGDYPFGAATFKD